MTDSLKAGNIKEADEYFPIEEAPKTPERAKPVEGTPGKKTPTPKLNEGTPSTLLTPVTPTVTQGSSMKVLSPKRPLPTSPVSDADDAEAKTVLNDNKADKIGLQAVVSGAANAADSTTASVGLMADAKPAIEGELRRSENEFLS